VLCADLVANPVFMPSDLLVLDGDLTGTPAEERLELLRGLMPAAGSHVVLPLQVVCRADEELEAAVDRCLAWRPSEGSGMAPGGVTAVQAAATYVHGPSEALAALWLRTGASKEADGMGGAGAGPTEPPDWPKRPPGRHVDEPGFLTPEAKSAGGERPDVTMGELLEMVGRSVLKYSPDQDRDDAGRWTSGGGGVLGASAADVAADEAAHEARRQADAARARLRPEDRPESFSDAEARAQEAEDARERARERARDDVPFEPDKPGTKVKPDFGVVPRKPEQADDWKEAVGFDTGGYVTKLYDESGALTEEGARLDGMVASGTNSQIGLDDVVGAYTPGLPGDLRVALKVRDTGEGAIMVSGKVWDGDTGVARFTRTLHLDPEGSSVHHDNFFVDDPERQGQGIGSLLAVSSDAMYRKAGVVKVELDAISDRDDAVTGAQVWPMQGFNWKQPDGLAVRRAFTDAIAGRYSEGSAEHERASEMEEDDAPAWEYARFADGEGKKVGVELLNLNTLRKESDEYHRSTGERGARVPTDVSMVRYLDDAQGGGHDYEAAWGSFREHVVRKHGAAAKRAVWRSATPEEFFAARDAVEKYSPDQDRDERGRWSDQGGGTATDERPEWDEPAPRDFAAARDLSSRRQFLSPADTESLLQNRLFLGHGGKVGFAITPEHDLVNVFNNGGPRGAGGEAVDEAVRRGALTLDAYDGHLPGFYRQHGFRETGRMAFDPDHAPEGWDYARYGHPDVVFMSYGAEGAAVRHYTADRWDEAKADALALARPPFDYVKPAHEVRTHEAGGINAGGRFDLTTRNMELEGHLARDPGGKTLFVDWLGPTGQARTDAMTAAGVLTVSPNTPVKPRPGELRSLVRALVAYADRKGATHVETDALNHNLYAKLMALGGRRTDLVGPGDRGGTVLLPVDSLRRVTKAEDDFWDDAFKDGFGGMISGGPGTIAPEQGTFGGRRRSRYVNGFLRVSREEGTNISVGVPFTLVPTRPTGSRRPEDERSNPGGPLFPHFVHGTGTGVHKYSPDQDRDERGRWEGLKLPRSPSDYHVRTPKFDTDPVEVWGKRQDTGKWERHTTLDDEAAAREWVGSRGGRVVSVGPRRPIAKYSPGQARDDQGQWTDEGGGVVFHGTSGKGTRFKPGVVYLAPSHGEAAIYATNEILRTPGGVPRVWEIQAKPGRTRDIAAAVNDELMGDGRIDELIASEASRARADGFRYLSFEHPGAGDDYIVARVSLFPDKDLKILRTRKPGDVVKYEEDQARDEQGRWTDEGGGEGASTIQAWPYEPADRARLIVVMDDDAVWNGVQHQPHGPDLAVFTDKDTGSTAMMPIDELTPASLRAKLVAIHTRFGKAADLGTGSVRGDGDSVGVGPGVVGGHRFVVGQLKDGVYVADPRHPRVNPYESLFQRKGVKLGRPKGVFRAQDVADDRFRAESPVGNNPDGRKPRKYPDVGEDMGFNDSYLSKVRDFLAKWVRKEYDPSQDRDQLGRWTSGGGSPDDAELGDKLEDATVEDLKTPLRDVSGEALVSPDGQAYSGGTHVEIARKLDMNVSGAVDTGWVRARVEYGSVGLELDLGNAKAIGNAIALLQAHSDVEHVHIDGPLFSNELSESFMTDKYPRPAGAASRWLREKLDTLGVRPKRKSFFLQAEPERAVVTKAEREGVDGKVRLGDCYRSAGHYVMDHRTDEYRMVHGTVDLRGVAISHAWVEFRDVVYEGVQGQFYAKSSYYRVMRAVPEQTYTAREAMDKMLETGVFGPWGPTAGLGK